MRRSVPPLAWVALAVLLASVASLVAVVSAPEEAKAAFPGKNGRLVFTQGTRGDIYTVQPDGTGLKQITRTGLNQDPAWSTDGRIAYARLINGDYEIYVKNTKNGQVTQLTDNSINEATPSWSPDGSRIVYLRGSEIWTMNADGSGQEYLGVGGSEPAWSPDGTRIAFVSSDVYVVNSDGSGGVVKLTDTRAQEGRSARSVSWSPDGNKIAFEAAEPGCCYLSDIYVVNADGTGQTNITNTPGGVGEINPAWSPNGRKIAYYFRTEQTSAESLYKMNPDGTNRQPILLNGGGRPDWRALPVAAG